MIAKKLGINRDVKLYFYLVLLIGSISQLALIFPSGLFRNGKVQFWGAQFHDGLWHVSVAQKIKDLSLENPVYSGETIQNYHILTDFFLAFISKFTGISLLHVTYRILPLIMTIALGVLTFVLVSRIFKSQKAAVWSMFFVYMGSNLAYILPYFGLGYDIWETTLWLQQPMSMFFNLPLATSLPFIFLAIITLKSYLEKGSRKYFVYSVILFAILPAIKSHSIIFLVALGIVGIWWALIKRKYDVLLLSVSAFILAAAIISPTFDFGNHLIFEPGWFLRTMIEAPDRMNWKDWALRYQFYKAHNNTLHLIRFFGVAFTIFFIGNLGTRVIAIFGIPKLKKLITDEINLLLIISAIFSVSIPMFFLTTNVAWNSIQFSYYYLFIAGIYSGVGMYKLVSKIKNSKIKLLFVLITVSLTIPVNIHTLWYYYSRPTSSVIKGEHLEALQKLSNAGATSDVILNLPAGSDAIEVAAFTGKSMFLGDWAQAVVPGHDHKARLDLLTEAMQNDEDFIKLLKKYGINWIYIKGSSPEIVSDIGGMVSEFYISDKIKVYHVEEN